MVSVVLSAAKDLIAARNRSTLKLLAMRSFAALRMTEIMTIMRYRKPAAGEVKKIFVGPADGVEAGDTLVTLDVNAGKAKAAAAAPGSLPQAAASTAPSSEGADKATDAKKEGGND